MKIQLKERLKGTVEIQAESQDVCDFMKQAPEMPPAVGEVLGPVSKLQMGLLRRGQ